MLQVRQELNTIDKTTMRIELISNKEKKRNVNMKKEQAKQQTRLIKNKFART